MERIVHPTRVPGYQYTAQPLELTIVAHRKDHVAVRAFQDVSVGGDVGMLSAISDGRLAVDELIGGLIDKGGNPAAFQRYFGKESAFYRLRVREALP